MSPTSKNIRQPVVVHYMQFTRTGVENIKYSRYAIGYVIQGKKKIYMGDTCIEVNRGDVFCLDIGSHYVEDIPVGTKPSEQIVFFFTSDILIHTMSLLQKEFGMVLDIYVDSDIRYNGAIVAPAWNSLKEFFKTVSHYDKSGLLNDTEIPERLMATMLLYLLLSNSDAPFYNYVIKKTSMMSEGFERVVHSSVFDDISIDVLAEKCNMSATSFKKEFRRVFGESPHRWFIRQRMIRSRHLLISSNKSVVEVGDACGFTNTSHYIKLFKQEYGVTPAVYRQMSRSGLALETMKEDT